MSAGEEAFVEILKDLVDGARELLRVMPSCDGEEPLKRLAQMQHQVDGLTAAAVGRARHRRVTWGRIGSILGISEDTARHRHSERYILRRISRLTRSTQQPCSLASLFSTPAATATTTPEGGSGPLAPPAPTEPAVPAGETAEPIAPSSPAYNRLAPILSMLLRTAQLPNKEVSQRIGCSASYLSRILSGDRVPTWTLTQKFAQVCGADPSVLRKVWESQKLSEKDRDATVTQHGTTRMPAAQRLRTAVETLHTKAGRPAAQHLAVASRWTLDTADIAALLEGEVLPTDEVLLAFVRLLGGDLAYFTTLLSDARYEAGMQQTPRQPPPPPAHPPAHAGGTAPLGGLDETMEAFSAAFTAQDPLEGARARLLSKAARRSAAPAEPAAVPIPSPGGTRTRAAVLGRMPPRALWA
ncbi:helix-turn-helix transcriptional regulator [Streptomyces sp. NPDC048659]|uniref:helix-turn-helix domain-containing protein n=1 Tax=Streptomyces sp. NPDC048659 TaxID=3155489 RepID=UPI00343C145B